MDLVCLLGPDRGGSVPVGRVEADRGRRKHPMLLVVNVLGQHLQSSKDLSPVCSAGAGAPRCSHRGLDNPIELVVLVEEGSDVVAELGYASHGRVQRKLLDSVVDLEQAIQCAKMLGGDRVIATGDSAANLRAQVQDLIVLGGQQSHGFEVATPAVVAHLCAPRFMLYRW